VSKVVDMKEVNELYKEYSQFANETITQLTELTQAIEQFHQLEEFTGQAATSAKAYMSEVHGSIIQSFILVISNIQVTFMNMIQEFQNAVDNNPEAIIHTDHFYDLKDTFRQHNHHFLDIHHDLLATIQKVSDIVSLSQPNPTRIEEMYYNVNIEISNRDLDVEAFDSMNRDKMDASSDLIQSIMNSMNEIKASISTPSAIRYTLGDITTTSWGARLGDTAAPVSKQLTEQLEEMKENAEIAKANAPEERNGFIDFLGEVFFVYDVMRLITGVDPITKERVTDADKALALIGFIPIGKFTKLAKLGKFDDSVLGANKSEDIKKRLENANKDIPKRHINPLDDPKIAKEVDSDPNAVYGYKPKSDSSLTKFKIDWTDPEEVAFARSERIKYLEKLEEKRKLLEKEVENLKIEGKTIEDIARIKVEQRNQERIDSYLKSDNIKGLEAMKERNLKQYGRPKGPTPEQLFEKYGSWDKVVFGTVRSSPAMDVLTGLYRNGGKK
jgi:LXG domain of WXG superfamily/Pre-toxin TG